MLKYIETYKNSRRFVNPQEITQILLKKDDNRITFNFRSLVEKTIKGQTSSGEIIPAFHFAEYSNPKEAKRRFDEIFEALKKLNQYNIIKTEKIGKYYRIINFNNVNSFYVTYLANNEVDLFVNFATTMTFQGVTFAEHSVKLTCDKDELFSQIKTID